jgi:hypothetical protein
MEHMEVHPAIDECWNKVLHNLQRETLAVSATSIKLIIISYESDNNIFDNKTDNNTWRGQRAIGVYIIINTNNMEIMFLLNIIKICCFFIYNETLHYIIYICKL